MKVAPSLPAGAVFANKYRVEKVLGGGGFGEVYLVEHLRVPSRYALKILYPHLSSVPGFRERFFREVRATQRIVHPNAVPVRDCDVTDEGFCYYTMDFIEGESLGEIVRRRGPISWRRALSVLRQVLDALGAAHRLGIVHRDVKPENILLEKTSGGERARVLDFGIAKLTEHDPASPTLTGHDIIGTFQYMPPEQAFGKGVDGRSDIYAIGVVIHRLVTGELPFKGPNPQAFAFQHLAEPPPPLRKVRPDLDLPGELESLVLTALGKQKEDRYPTAEAMVAAIDAVLRLPEADTVLTPGAGGLSTPAPEKARNGSAKVPGPAAGTPGRRPSLPGTGGSGEREAVPSPLAGGGGTGSLTRAVLRVSGALPEGRIFVFAGERLRIGRARGNEVVLRLLPCRSEVEDPENWRLSEEVSRVHVQLEAGDAGRLTATDRSSRGTWLETRSAGGGPPSGPAPGVPPTARRLPAGRPEAIDDRFALALARALVLEGTCLRGEDGGIDAVIVRRPKNAPHHVYALVPRRLDLGLAFPDPAAPPLDLSAAVGVRLVRTADGFAVERAGFAPPAAFDGAALEADAAALLERGVGLVLGPPEAPFATLAFDAASDEDQLVL